MNGHNKADAPLSLCIIKYFALFMAFLSFGGFVGNPTVALFAQEDRDQEVAGLLAPASLTIGMIGFSLLLPEGPAADAVQIPPGDFAELDAALSVVGSAGAIAAIGAAGLGALLDRPRPFVGRRDEAWSADALQSFPSGHAILAWSAAGYSLAVSLRNPKSLPWFAASSTFAVATLILRIASGEHYVEDVLFGAVIGLTIGLTMPYVMDLLL